MKKRICVVVTLVLLAAFCIPAGFGAAEETVVFSDPVLETRVRQAIGVPEGEITLETAKEITGLDLAADENAPESERIRNLEALLYFPNLEYLNLDNNRIEDVGILLDLKNLKDLSVYGNPIGKLPKLGVMTGLERLCFDAQLNDISFVTGLTNLTELIATGVRSLPDALPELTRLNALCVPGGELEDITIVAQLPNLHALDISWNLVSDLSVLEGMPLTELYIEGNPIESYEPVRDIVPNLIGTNVDFDAIFVDLIEPDDPGLVIVFQDALLERCVRDALQKPEGDLTAGDLAAITKLEWDNEWQPQIPEELAIHDLTGMEYCINLHTLSLCCHAISDLTPLQGLHKLVVLRLGSNQITDLGALQDMTMMQELRIFGNRITDLSPLMGMMNLHTLQLDNNSIADLSPLTALPGLNSLSVCSNCITDLSPLAGLANLRELYLKGNPIADASAMQAIYSNLSERDFVYGLWFEEDEPSQDAGETVTIPDPLLQSAIREIIGKPEGEIYENELMGIEWLPLSSDWQEERLEGSRIADLTGLEACENLKGLELQNADVHDLSPLQGLQKLELLNLLNNGITDIGPLGQIQSLQWVELRSNAITDFSPLAGLGNLYGLLITDNPGTDYAPLADIYPNLTEKDFELP